MKIRLYHARILTMNPGEEIFRGEIHVEEDRITNILREGETDAASKEIVWDREVDCEGNLLMPGLKDAHTHSPMTFLRSYAEDKPTQQWLEEDIFPNEEKLTEEDIYDFARLAILEYIAGGITSIFDMYLKPEVMARACIDTGMRCVLVSGLNNFTSSIDQTRKEYLLLNMIDPLITYQLGFHAEYTCSPDLLHGVAALSRELRAPVYCHLNETKNEVADCLLRTGLTPLTYLESMGIFEQGGGCFHCNHMTEQELQLMQIRHMYVVSNPASNMKLASGIAPLTKFRKLGIPVALGTDGPASNNALDMFREMYLAAMCARIREEDASAISAEEVLEMATVNGARVMRLPQADRLGKGKLADIILLDLKAPNMQPLHNVKRNLVFAAHKGNCKMTMIGGKILYLDGKFDIGEEPESIYSKVRARCKRIFPGFTGEI